MYKKIPSGLLVVIEGIDGAGKSTQAKRLGQRLNDEGFESVLLREPTDGPFGKKIRDLAATGRFEPREEMELFIKDRTQNVEENIRPSLEAGKVVILDRYYFSSIAYQGSRGIDPDFIRSENEKIAPAPDVLIYLRIPLELAERRICEGRGDVPNQFEQVEYLGKVMGIFEGMVDPFLVRVDGDREFDLIENEIFEITMQKISEKVAL